jgi:hypothetical protein
MPQTPRHTWQFRHRFRRDAYGWRSSSLAVQRVREAVSEIKKAARRDPMLGAEGAILFLEKVSAALMHVDSSTGALGTAVNKAVATLAVIIAKAPADPKTRDRWLDRLWAAHEDDEMPYLDVLGDHWGAVCASKEVASRWADDLLTPVRESWRPDADFRWYFAGTTHCLSALLAAERYEELLELLDLSPNNIWHYRMYGVEALVRLGRRADALRYAEERRALNDSHVAIARKCEEILLDSGLRDEAYERYAFEANQAGTYLAWFRGIVKRYPHKDPAEILTDLVAATPGDEGKWFAAAKDAGLLGEAIALANATPCAPQTLTRAARDFATSNPEFAVEAGMAALRWVLKGYDYEITGLDALAAYRATMAAAENLGRIEETRARVGKLVASETRTDSLVTRVLERELRLVR